MPNLNFYLQIVFVDLVRIRKFSYFWWGFLAVQLKNRAKKVETFATSLEMLIQSHLSKVMIFIW